MFHVNSDFHCPRWIIMASVLLLNALSGSSTRADEGGTSFWLPGQYGSFAAVAPGAGCVSGDGFLLVFGKCECQ